MAFVKSLTNISFVLSALCSIVLSQGMLGNPAPTATTQDQNLFANLFTSTGSTQMDPTIPAAGSPPLTSFLGGTPPATFGAPGAYSAPPNPSFPALGGMPPMQAPVAQPPPTAPQKDPMSGLMKMMLFRSMGMDNMWPLLALGGGRGGGGGMFNPFLLMGMANM